MFSPRWLSLSVMFRLEQKTPRSLSMTPMTEICGGSVLTKLAQSTVRIRPRATGLKFKVCLNRGFIGTREGVFLLKHTEFGRQFD